MEERSSHDHDVFPGPTVGEERDQSFFSRLPGAFVYPFKGQGWAIIVAGAVFFALLGLVRFIVTALTSWMHPYYGILIRLSIWAVTCVIGCILPAYLLEILARSASGEDEPPDWPSVTTWWEDLLMPVFLILGAAAVSFLPAWACRFALYYGLMDNAAPMWVFIAVGVLYFPMALIGVVIFDGLAGLNPIKVFPAITKIAPAYLVACVMLAIVMGAWVVLGTFLWRRIPVIGSILSGVAMLYFLMVEMRILGLLYRVHEKRLGWFA
ncbi:MAG: hypothetical protein SVV80_01315 [Planctomycetota bacterium]|nr:hypothetical protein [Planctomycetota bacterium]